MPESENFPLISNVRIQSPERSGELARASLVVGGGVVVKGFSLIRTHRGLEVRMPSKPAQLRCAHCYNPNFVKSRYCGNCGMRINNNPYYRNGRPVIFEDVVHPLSSEFRARVEAEVIQAYEKSKTFEDEGDSLGSGEEDAEFRDYERHNRFD